MRKELVAALRRKSVPMDANHREALEQGLLAEFDRHARPQSARRGRWPHYAIAALAVASLLVASQAPAELELEVGQRITIELAVVDPAELEKLGQIVAQAVQPEGRGLGTVRVDMRPGGTAMVTADVWGNPSVDVRERVQGLPEMASARVHVAPLRGHVRDTVLRKIWYLVRHDASPAELEFARQQVVDELRRQEPDSVLDVDVSVDDATHRVRVKKVKRGVAPP